MVAMRTRRDANSGLRAWDERRRGLLQKVRRDEVAIFLYSHNRCGDQLRDGAFPVIERDLLLIRRRIDPGDGRRTEQKPRLIGGGQRLQAHRRENPIFPEEQAA